MIRINQVKLPVEQTTEELHKKVQELLKYKGSMDVEIVKRSLDARKKPQLFYVYMLDVTIPEKEERKLLKRCRSSQIQKVEPVKNGTCRTVLWLCACQSRIPTDPFGTGKVR